MGSTSLRDALAGDDGCKKAFRRQVRAILTRGQFLGPTGRNDGFGEAILENVLHIWREHFVLEEDMSEEGCPYVFPKILNEWKHVQMLKDEEAGIYYRADGLLIDFINEKLTKDTTISEEQAAEFQRLLPSLYRLSADELTAKIEAYGITAPGTRNRLSVQQPSFKVIRQTSLIPSPSSLLPVECYIRPDTVPGNFMPFERVYESKDNKLPLAIAYTGQAFIEEISPRRNKVIFHEFTIAEIEHFIAPEAKSHRRFSEVADLELLMFPGEEQTGGSASETTLGEAVSKRIVDNSTLGYFIGRVFLFLTRLGIDKNHLRFRQRLGNEMTHYAADCWVAEIECSYGWLECVDIADRSAYDLQALMEKSGVPFVAHENCAEPREVVKLVIAPNEEELGLVFRENEKKMVVESLLAMREEEALQLKTLLKTNGKAGFRVRPVGRTVKIMANMVEIFNNKIREDQRDIIPSAIESSFGIERILYCLFEHSFYTRPGKAGDGRLNVFRFPPLVAPLKCAVFPLINLEDLEESANSIRRVLAAYGITLAENFQGRIGRKYIRSDELGVPFAITIDGKRDATLRERDSKRQVRVSGGDAATVARDLIFGYRTWSDIWWSFPHFTSASAEEDE